MKTLIYKLKILMIFSLCTINLPEASGGYTSTAKLKFKENVEEIYHRVKKLKKERVSK